MYRLTSFVLAFALMPGALVAQSRSVADFMAAVEGPQPGAHPDSLGAMTIAQLMEHFGVPGVSVAVIRDFDIHWAKGYGIADVETGAPVTTETVFEAGSISKPVAAMGVLRAVQDGLFGLDDDINTILKSWKLPPSEFTRDRPVTPRTLTSHTSGMGDGFGYPGYDPAGPIPTLAQTLEGHELSNTGPVFLERPPLTFQEYSGGGVSVMQQALTDARGRPFPELMKEHVLDPIGMTNSTYQQPIPPAWDAHAARAHDDEGHAMGPKWHAYPEMAAAGLWTTASDLARFAIEVQKSAVGRSNKVLTRAMTQEMLSPVGVGPFAVGFVIAQRGQGWYFMHGGSDWGFNADLRAHKVKGYGSAVMTNGDRGGALAAEITRRIEVAYGWDSQVGPVPRGYAALPPDGGLRLSAEQLGVFVGRYEFPDLFTADVEVADGRLVARVDEDTIPLTADTPTSFVAGGGFARIVFEVDGGRVVGVSIEVSGRGHPARIVRSGPAGGV
jgi:CubicO group peptidase (beta-lactamase class C family)